MSSQRDEQSKPHSAKPSDDFRWPDIKPKEKVLAINDPLEFVPNKCSQRARLQHTNSQRFDYELWIDQHYHSRQQLGDDNGKRDGIEPEVVESIVRRAFSHLMLYSTMVKGFYFINHNNNPTTRILLQEVTEEGIINVPIEAHFLAINKFEITIKTAMRHDNFKIEAGQYVVELEGDSSILKKYENSKLTEIYKL